VVVAGGTSNQTIYQIALANATANGSQTDWLSGDSTAANAGSANPGAKEPGHLIYTYAADTYLRPGVITLSSFSLGLGILIAAGLDKSLEAWVLDRMPDWLTALTTKF